MVHWDYILVEEDQTKGHVLLNGEVLNNSSIKQYGDGSLYASLWGDDVSRIADFTLSVLPTWERIEFHFGDTGTELSTWQFGKVNLHLRESAGSETTEVQFEVDFDSEFWNKPYSVADLAEAILEVVDRDPTLGFEYWQFHENTAITGFGLSRQISVTSTVRNVVELHTAALRIAEMIEAEIFRSSGTVVLPFCFPESLRVACEQYLMYFAQFLSDLGIEAETEIKEERGKVLFRVNPRDKREALVYIEQALAQYLLMPTLSDLESVTRGLTDVAVQQLKANVLHFQSQIILLRAVLEQKSATIAAQNAQISALEERIDMRQFLPAQGSSKPGSDAETVIEGVLTVKDFEKSGVVIKLPEILRKLKRSFST